MYMYHQILASDIMWSATITVKKQSPITPAKLKGIDKVLFCFRSHFTAEKGGFFQGAIGQFGCYYTLKAVHFCSKMASKGEPMGVTIYLHIPKLKCCTCNILAVISLSCFNLCTSHPQVQKESYIPISKLFKYVLVVKAEFQFIYNCKMYIAYRYRSHSESTLTVKRVVRLKATNTHLFLNDKNHKGVGD